MEHKSDDLKEFFQKLKEQDQRHTDIPSFEKLNTEPPKKPRKWMYMASAIVVLGVVSWFGLSTKKQGSIETSEMVMTITFSDEQEGTTSLLENTPSIAEWKPITDSLINEFEE